MKTVIWILLLNAALAFPDLAAQRIHSLDLDAPRPPVRRGHLDLGGESITGERVAVNNQFIEVDGRPCNAAIVTRGSIPVTAGYAYPFWAPCRPNWRNAQCRCSESTKRKRSPNTALA